jgi:regulator of protease activity HflC (stomatin/prohibitin superfamily)
MSTPTVPSGGPHDEDPVSPRDRVQERPVTGFAGRGMIRVGAVAFAGLIVLFVTAVRLSSKGTPSSLAWAGVVVLVILVLIAGRGLVSVPPGEAVVVQLFGRYQGTIREPGLSWVLPQTKRQRISVKIRSFETGISKVNDADGNPVEIAVVTVWQVTDTAQAVFAVEDVTRFVAIQAEIAVRQIASTYPYDDLTGGGKPCLRASVGEITTLLTAEIAARVGLAGVAVMESRLTRLSYAPEIAHAMLRRQQADAVVAARQKIVDGAVSMVESALERLASDDIVDFDEERKAAMVSNMLVVLCSDQATHPVINTGTLYQ